MPVENVQEVEKFFENVVGAGKLEPVFDPLRRVVQQNKQEKRKKQL